MELWIRSQDKEVLSKVNNLCYYTREDVLEFIKEEELKKDIQHIIWSPDGSILGYYKTKERALEVLDEIQNMIKPTLINTEYHSEIKQGVDKLSFDVVMQPIEDKITYIQPNVVIYEMPKE